MQEAGFEPTLPLYVATGLLSYGAELEFQGGVNMLVQSHLCSEVLYKEQYMPIFELQRESAVRDRAGKQAAGVFSAGNGPNLDCSLNQLRASSSAQ